MPRTADEIAGMYLGGDAARADLKSHILEYGEAMALAAATAEREACAKIADAQRHDETKDGTLYADYDYGWDGAANQISTAIRARNASQQ